MSYSVQPNLAQADTKFQVCKMHHNEALKIAYTNRLNNNSREMKSLEHDYESRMMK